MFRANGVSGGENLKEIIAKTVQKKLGRGAHSRSEPLSGRERSESLLCSPHREPNREKNVVLKGGGVSELFSVALEEGSRRRPQLPWRKI